MKDFYSLSVEGSPPLCRGGACMEFTVTIMVVCMNMFYPSVAQDTTEVLMYAHSEA